MTVRSGSLLALLALAFGVFDCAVYSDALLGQGGAVDPAGGSASGDSTAGKGQGGSSGSVVSSAGNEAVAGGGGDIGLGSAGDDSSTAGTGNPSGGAVALGGMTSSGGAGKGGTAGNGGSNASGGTSGNAGSTSGGAGKGGSAGTAGAAGTSGSAGMGNIAGTGGTAGTAGSGGTSGTAGSAGGSTVPKCSDHALTAHAAWSASASTFHVNEPASYLIDNTKTRWTTGLAQAGTEWIQIDFGATVAVRSINLQQGVDSNDYPRSYAVIVSDVAKDLTGTVRASGVGSSTVTTTITLPSVFSGRYLLIKQLGTSLSWWSVEEVEVSCFD